MAEQVKYYELYGELVRSKAFLQRLVFLLVLINIVLAGLCYIAYTRPSQTFAIKDGYAYATGPYQYERSTHEVRMFADDFARNLLEFNRDNFNEHIRYALQKCSQELEYLMYQTIRESEIPVIVKRTDGTIRFQVDEIQVREGDPFRARVSGKQIFPGQDPLDVTFDLDIIVVSRTEQNPFGLKIINFKQS